MSNYKNCAVECGCLGDCIALCIIEYVFIICLVAFCDKMYQFVAIKNVRNITVLNVCSLSISKIFPC